MTPLPAEQLFDTEADPHEVVNLAASDKPEHKAALLKMRAALDTWIAETGDRGEFPRTPRNRRTIRKRDARLVRNSGLVQQIEQKTAYSVSR